MSRAPVKGFTQMDWISSGATLSRDERLHTVWGYNSSVMTRTVDVHVGVLRQKLEDHPRKPRYILTVHGLGYKFTDSRA